MKQKRLILYFILLVVLLTLFSLQTIRMSNQYSVWQGHYEILENENKTIESWMTINLVNKHFNIEFDTIFNILNITDTPNDRRLLLSEVCIKYNIDCNEKIEILKND